MSPKNTFLLLFLIAILCVQNVCLAQGLRLRESNASPNLFSKVGGDISHIFFSPARLNKRKSLTFLALTSITLGFISTFDKEINNEFLTQNGSKSHSRYFTPLKGLANVGDVYDKISSINVLMGLSGAMLLTGTSLADDKMKSTARLLIESYFIAGALTKFGKGMFGRARPYVKHGSKDFNFLEFSSTTDYHSFPSGHTTSAFSMMTVLAKQYDHWWVKIPAYTLAVSVALQRIDSSNHWGSDVLAGGAIGYWVGSTLVNRYNNLSTQSKLQPVFLGNQAGLFYVF